MMVGHTACTAKACPGGMTSSCSVPPGLQSSDDHTRNPPEVTRNDVAEAPTSWMQGESPVLATAITKTTSPPAVGVGVSTDTVTSRSPVRHGWGSPDAAASPVSLGLASSVGEAEGVPLADAEDVAPDGEADVLGRAAGSASPPDGHSHASSATTPSTAAIRTIRRRQYTASGSGPTGFLMVSTGETVNPNGLPETDRTAHDPLPHISGRGFPDPHGVALSATVGAPDDISGTLAIWFQAHQRDLPWRRDPTPWGVMVSEFMLQQTPVQRVLPVWDQWLNRWPTPAALAVEPAAEAIRAWGRLGYPRRAMRLHAASVAITEQHAGAVPSSYEALVALPGVGDYTAAAIVSFAFGGRALVMDVNIRRFLARYFRGEATAPAHITAAEREMARALVPWNEPATWAAATMELGQTICTARDPACDRCPVAAGCAWLGAGKPGAEQRTTRPQKYEGTDRYVRGLIMARLREGPADMAELRALRPMDPIQLDRALDSLISDGLVDPSGADRFSLPGDE